MGSRWPDYLIFQATGVGDSITAQRAIDQARKFLLGLEAASPWKRPFDVSGITAKHANLPIAEDLSDFDQVVMQALASYKDVKYINYDEPENWKLGPNSLSPYGFTTSFSDYIQRRNQSLRIDVSIRTPGISQAPATFVATISVRAFLCGEVNEEWSSKATAHNVFDYMIDFFNPINCVVYSNESAKDIIDFEMDQFLLGWLTYTRNSRFSVVLAGDYRVRNYRDGILISLGEDVSVLTDPKKRGQMIEIRDKLRAAGVSDWLKPE